MFLSAVCTLQGGRAARSGRSRTIAGAVAAVSALLALAAVTNVVRKASPTTLMQLGPLHVDNVELHHLAAPFTNLAHKGEAYFASAKPAAAPAPAPHKGVKQMKAAGHHKIATEAATAAPAKGAQPGVVYYYMPSVDHKGAKLAQSKLQHLASGQQQLAAPSPGTFVSPNVGDGPTVSLFCCIDVSWHA